MASYTVILLLESKPVQQTNVDDETFVFVSEQESAASPAAALTAAIAAQQAAWVASMTAAYYPNGTPGGVPQFLAANAPAVHAYVTLNGTVTVAASGQLSQPQPKGSPL